MIDLTFYSSKVSSWLQHSQTLMNALCSNILVRECFSQANPENEDSCTTPPPKQDLDHYSPQGKCINQQQSLELLNNSIWLLNHIMKDAQAEGNYRNLPGRDIIKHLQALFYSEQHRQSEQCMEVLSCLLHLMTDELYNLEELDTSIQEIHHFVMKVFKDGGGVSRLTITCLAGFLSQVIQASSIQEAYILIKQLPFFIKALVGLMHQSLEDQTESEFDLKLINCCSSLVKKELIFGLQM